MVNGGYGERNKLMITIEFEEAVCCSCGTRFQMDATLRQMRLKDGLAFSCPNGHAQTFKDGAANEIKDLKERVKIIEDELNQKRIELTKLKCELIKLRPTDPSTSEKGFWKKILG